MKFRHLALLVLITLLCTQCSKTDLITIEGIETIDIIDCFEISETQLVINDAATYQTMLAQKVFSDPCSSYILPEVNFVEKTLLGKFTEALACDVFYERRVEADPDSESYIYRITVHLDGQCQFSNTSMNWITVPKLPENYTVSFEVDYKSS